MSTVSTAKRRRIAAGLGLSAVTLFVAFVGGLIRPADWLVPSQSATLFPAAALIGAAICGLFIARAAPGGEEESAGPPIDLRSIMVGVAAALYALAVPHLGLVASTIALCVAVPLALGYRNWVGIVAFLVVIIGLSWLVFIRLLNVPLPL